jgi:hypothetical protein
LFGGAGRSLDDLTYDCRIHELATLLPGFLQIGRIDFICWTPCPNCWIVMLVRFPPSGGFASAIDVFAAALFAAAKIR